MTSHRAPIAGPFVLVLPYRPASQQSEGRGKYQQRVRAAAIAAFQGREQLDGSLYAHITYLHRLPTTQDVDNIAKPIIDALAGVVFADDRLVRQCIVERIFIPDGFTISEQHRPAAGVEHLEELIADTNVAHVIFIEVGQAPIQAVTFGPLAEG